jgi:hypothetical protein
MSEEEREDYFTEMRQRRKQQAEETRAKLARVLLPAQMERLTQISIQVRGATALGDAEVAAALGLEEAQQEELQSILQPNRDTTRPRMRRPFQDGNGDDLRDETDATRNPADEHAIAVLTPEQKTTFIELQGEPFEMPADAETLPGRAESIVRGPIEKGLVVVDGRYVPPPYLIRREGDEVFVNDEPVPSQRLAGPDSGPASAPRPPAGFGRWTRWSGDGPRFPVLWLEEHLHGDSLLLVIEDEAAALVAPAQAEDVLDTLLSDASNPRKAQALTDGPVGALFNPAQWATIVESFQPTPDLVERIERQKAKYARLKEEARAARWRNAVLDSAPMRYGVTLVAMGLAVIALGTLLSQRPNNGARWTEIDKNGDGLAMVVRNVFLLALLNGFDLGLTLVAQQGGGMLELNPLGDALAKHPAYLASFKIGVVLTACFILLALRKYRGAQAASWWLCLICTILTFRWLTYNSMFLT